MVLSLNLSCATSELPHNGEVVEAPTSKEHKGVVEEVDVAKTEERATLEDAAAIEAEPDDDSAVKARLGFVEEAERGAKREDPPDADKVDRREPPAASELAPNGEVVEVAIEALTSK